MDKAILNSGLVATKAGDITVYNYDGETREYISTSTEYLAVGVGIPACSCLDAPVTHKAGYTICRSVDLKSWEYVSDHRGEIVYNTETGDAKEITAPGDYPENTTTTAHVSKQATQTPDAASTGKIPWGYTIAAINSAIHNIRNSPLINFFFISVCSL